MTDMSDDDATKGSASKGNSCEKDANPFTDNEGGVNHGMKSNYKEMEKQVIEDLDLDDQMGEVKQEDVDGKEEDKESGSDGSNVEMMSSSNQILNKIKKPSPTMEEIKNQKTDQESDIDTDEAEKLMDSGKDESNN